MRVNTKYRKIRSAFSLSNNKVYRSINGMEPKSVVNTIPLTWARAKDFSIVDPEGNTFIDLTCGIFVANSGHSNPAIKKAIKDQIDSDLLFSYNYPTEIKEKFLKKLLQLAPKYFNRVALLNTGSEAVDLAYKIMKVYGKKTKKKYIVTFTGSYHGRGLSNDLICGAKDKATRWSGVTDKYVRFIEFPYEEGTKFDPKKLPPAGEIAGFMLETFQGWGTWFYPKQFLRDLYKFARKNKALVCFDEMQAGFYRLGPIFGYMTYGKDIQPDIICVGKAITSSLPLAAVISRRELVDIDKADMHGTQSSNPLCLAAALANIKFLSANIAKFRKVMKVFESEMNKLTEFGIVKKVNARGMIAGIIFDETEPATAIVKNCIRNGVLPVCTNRNSIKIAPPLTITLPALREAVSVLRAAIELEDKKQ